MALDLTAFAAALKQLYPDWKIQKQVYQNRPLLALMPKFEEFSGNAIKFPLIYGNPQNRSNTFAQALANTSTSKLESFLVTRKKNYSLGAIDNETMLASESSEGAFLEAARVEVDGALDALGRSLSIQLFRSGTGTIGTVKAATSPATTIELANPEDVVNFEVGMILAGSTTDGGGTDRSAHPTITAIDRINGILTVSPTVSGDYAAGDYLYNYGDKNAALTGLGGWLPYGSGRTAALAASFYGVTRSTDSVRLGGVTYDGSAQPVEEAFIDGLRLISREGGMPEYVFVNHKNYSDLIKALGSKVQRTQISTEIREGSNVMAVVGFEAIEIYYPGGVVKVMADRDCPVNYAFALTMNTWKLCSLGKAVRLFEGDGLKMLRSASADALEFRCFSYSNMYCTAPGMNGVIQLA